MIYFLLIIFFFALPVHLNCEKFQGFLLSEFGRGFRLYLESSKKENENRERLRQLDSESKDRIRQLNILYRRYRLRKSAFLHNEYEKNLQIRELRKQNKDLDFENFCWEHRYAELKLELDAFKACCWNVSGCLY
jgi:hypothetical protein